MELSAITRERRSQRQKTFKGGLIIYGLSPPVECIIRNLSDNGAALQVRDSSSIPDTFQVLIKPEMIKRNCKVVWRSETKLGVQFG